MMVASLIDTDPAGAVSSFRMVPTPTPLSIFTPFVALDSLRRKVYSASRSVSPRIVMSMVFEISPAAKDSVPERAT